MNAQRTAAPAEIDRLNHQSLLDAALADLDRVTSEVIQHNAAQMQHPHMRAWLTADRREPDNGAAGIVSTAPHAQLIARMRRGEAVTLAEVCQAIARMQRNLQRMQKRVAKRNAERRAA
ncbi:hypothetical protein ACNQFN_08270 [Thauera butanivorans]|uniref:hypothetical protein n=1 Tax=Thauera butanivorans TaxID=86174 RepID=UPI003AB24C46